MKLISSPKSDSSHKSTADPTLPTSVSLKRLRSASKNEEKSRDDISMTKRKNDSYLLIEMADQSNPSFDQDQSFSNYADQFLKEFKLKI